MSESVAETVTDTVVETFKDNELTNGVLSAGLGLLITKSS